MGEEVVDLACIGVGEATIDGLGSRARQERASHWGEAHEGGEERATWERCTGQGRSKPLGRARGVREATMDGEATYPGGVNYLPHMPQPR